MTFTLLPAAYQTALFGALLLLVFWLIVSRQIFGFFLICLGWSVIAALMLGDGTLRTFLNELAIGAFCSLVVLVLLLLRRARRRRVPVYVPIDKRRRSSRD